MDKEQIRFFKYLIVLLSLLSNVFAQSVVINEIMSSNSKTISDEDGDFSDWIELYNNSGSNINLNDFTLSDNISETLKWRFPAVTIAANDHLLIFASGKNRSVQNYHWETIIRSGDIWTYRINTTEVAGNWKLPGFDDGSWSSGPTGIGYGDDDDATPIPTGTLSIYTRKTFQITDKQNILDAVLHIDYDDGFVAYLNGIEVARANINGESPAYNQTSITYTEPKMVFGQDPDEFEIENIQDLLVQGENVLAVQVHNSGEGSSDMTFIPFFTLQMVEAPDNPKGVVGIIKIPDSYLHTNFKLNSEGESLILVNAAGTITDHLAAGVLPKDISWGRQPDGTDNWHLFGVPTPGSENNSEIITGIAQPPLFSTDRGFFNESFDLNIVSPDNAWLKLTLDGSDPLISSSALEYQSSALLNINPEMTSGQRGQNPGVVVRAYAYGSGLAASEVVTHTYLFAERVKDLSADGQSPGPNWPDPFSGWGSHAIDYGMDPEVMNDSRFKDKIDASLLDIPSIILSTDLDNLFDEQTGIYMNAHKHGREWERPVSVELLNPDGSDGFQINAGLRIRGGWSRHPDNPKHAFRLFFRGEYGESKLRYPLFEDEGVNEFEKVDLRTSQNYSWSYNGSYLNTMNRDVFSRDLQAEMGHLYMRSRYYHLYINGVYWGLYQTQERGEARFAASYNGGDSDDYDVVKVDVGENWNLYDIEATDGNLEAWEEVWQYCQGGFSSNLDYFKIQGRQPNGEISLEHKKLIDIENLIDYMLIIFYTGNYDAPVTKFRNNIVPNNFITIFDRVSPDGFKFLVHDAEHTLLIDPINVGDGLWENRVYIGDPPDGIKVMQVWDFQKFHPQWLHFKLSDNAEYRTKFADHVYKHFFREGIFTHDITSDLFLSRSEEIELAIIAESARWGDAKLENPGTQAHWQNTIDDLLNDYFPLRTGIVLSQLRNEGLYPNINPPIFADDSEIMESKLIVNTGYELKIENQNANGEIYYTLDGKDPRQIGGAVSENALTADDPVEMTINATSVFKTRIKYGNTWSALNQLTLLIDNDLSDLRITEIHYHPLVQSSMDDKDYEFLEIKNVGQSALDLTDCYFYEGINYTFPANSILDPGEFIVLASNKNAFSVRYRLLPFGEFTGQLNNAGERITLLSASADSIISIRYDDADPWPKAADGAGYSLVTSAANPYENTSDPALWRLSSGINGSPGADDPGSTRIEEEKTGMPDNFQLFQNYPNPFNPSTIISYSLPENASVRVRINNLLGERVRTLFDGFQSKGLHKVSWDGTDDRGSTVSNGIYIYTIELKHKSSIMSHSRKMLLLK